MRTWLLYKNDNGVDVYPYDENEISPELFLKELLKKHGDSIENVIAFDLFDAPEHGLDAEPVYLPEEEK